MGFVIVIFYPLENPVSQGYSARAGMISQVYVVSMKYQGNGEK